MGVFILDFAKEKKTILVSLPVPNKLVVIVGVSVSMRNAPSISKW